MSYGVPLNALPGPWGYQLLKLVTVKLTDGGLVVIHPLLRLGIRFEMGSYQNCVAFTGTALSEASTIRASRFFFITSWGWVFLWTGTTFQVAIRADNTSELVSIIFSDPPL